jgi:hypothetical protein
MAKRLLLALTLTAALFIPALARDTACETACLQEEASYIADCIALGGQSWLCSQAGARVYCRCVKGCAPATQCSDD